MGCFSLDEARGYCGDKRALHEYVPPPLGCDLSDGFPDRFVECSEDAQKEEHLGSLLRFVQDNPECLQTHDKTVHGPPVARPVNFVTWRGLLTKIMTAPFSYQNELRISLLRREGTIYMSEYETEGERAKRHGRSARETLMCYWGHRFEGYCIRKTPGA